MTVYFLFPLVLAFATSEFLLYLSLGQLVFPFFFEGLELRQGIHGNTTISVPLLCFLTVIMKPSFGGQEAFVQLSPLQISALGSFNLGDAIEHLWLKGCPEVSACGERITN